MEMKGKTKSIFGLFLKSLIAFSAFVVGIILMAYFIISLFIQFEIVYPANYADVKISQIEAELQTNFNEKQLPAYSKYLLMDKDLKLIDTNMKDKDVQKLKAYLSKGKKSFYKFYKLIEMDNGNTVIIQYDMLAHFVNPKWNRVIPYPEVLLLLLVLFLIILFSVMTALRFSRTLKNNLIPIEEAAEKIKSKNLDFDIKPSRIREFNTSLDVMDQLKTALAKSLQSQWYQEERKKSQLSALCHDIKTPLTVIKGNVQLLAEQNREGDCMEMLTDMEGSVDQMGEYIDILIKTLNQDLLRSEKKQVMAEDFIKEVSDEIEALCKLKDIDYLVQNDIDGKILCIDSGLLKRAILNLADNAVRFCDSGAKINLHIYKEGQYVLFKMSDEGSGFSKESLQKAAEEFYSTDRARTGKNYGLGLSFAKNVAGLHGGTLLLANNENGKGAVVTVSISDEI